tara:strand:+ start:2953 stop:4416 length:1464 start_codon:yes stop_codon:yes gene_type:complete
MGSGDCFTPNTPVEMGDGASRPIFDIKIGDIVRGKDGYNTVVDTPRFLMHDNTLYGINGENPWFTGMHPFYTEEGWACADPQLFLEAWPDDYYDLAHQNSCMEMLTLKVGSRVFLVDEWVDVDNMPELFNVRSDFTTYNLRVTGDHTFFANGYLVHNKGGADPGDDAIGVSAANAAAAAAQGTSANSAANPDAAASDTASTNSAAANATAEAAESSVSGQGVTGDGTGVGAISGDDPNSAGVTGGSVSDDPGIDSEGGQNGTAQGAIDSLFGQSMVDSLSPTDVGFGILGAVLSVVAPPLGMALSLGRGANALGLFDADPDDPNANNTEATSTSSNNTSVTSTSIDTSLSDLSEDPSTGQQGFGGPGVGGSNAEVTDTSLSSLSLDPNTGLQSFNDNSSSVGGDSIGDSDSDGPSDGGDPGLTRSNTKTTPKTPAAPSTGPTGQKASSLLTDNTTGLGGLGNRFAQTGPTILTLGLLNKTKQTLLGQ